MGSVHAYRIIASAICAGMMLIGGCNLNDTSTLATLPSDPLPPYPVISGDPAVDPSVRELTISLPPGSSYQLTFDTDSSGNADPNGDAVVYESDLPTSTLIYFDYDTGILYNNSFASSYRIEFWSRERDTADQLDTSDNPLVLNVDGGGGGT